MIDISFIIPVYNAETSIQRCIESLLGQDVNKEILLVDDGSSDESVNIINTYVQMYDRIKLIQQEHLGAAEARNKGIQSAQGKWVCFVDSDDYLYENCMKKVIENVPFDMQIIYTDYAKERGNNIVEYRYQAKKKFFDGSDFDAFKHAELNKCKCPDGLQIFTPWAKLFNREFLIQNDIHFVAGVRKSHDVLFNFCAVDKANKGLYIPTLTYVYSYNEASLCNKYIDGVINDYMKQQSVMLDVLKSDRDRTQFINDFYIRCIVNFLYAIQIDFAHKNNSKPYKERREDFLKCREKDVYKQAFDNVDVSAFSLKEKMFFIIAKKKFFWISQVIVRMYNMWRRVARR